VEAASALVGECQHPCVFLMEGERELATGGGPIEVVEPVHEHSDGRSTGLIYDGSPSSVVVPVVDAVDLAVPDGYKAGRTRVAGCECEEHRQKKAKAHEQAGGSDGHGLRSG